MSLAGVALGVIDLSARVDMADISPALAQDQVAAVPVIAFGPHKDVDAFRDAKAAGITRVMSNSQFQANTVAMIQRYARVVTAGDND